MTGEERLVLIDIPINIHNHFIYSNQPSARWIILYDEYVADYG
jgi:hypothetical protein